MEFSKPTFSDHDLHSRAFWRCNITGAQWAELTTALVWFESSEDDSFEPVGYEQLTALQQMLDVIDDVRVQVSESVVAEAERQLEQWVQRGMDESIARTAMEAGIGTSIKLTQVMIWRPRRGQVLIGFDFDWIFEQEHGLGVLWADGHVVRAGSEETAHPNPDLF